MFSVDSTSEIAPASGPFFVYGVHDPEWQPIGPEKSLGALTGSVGVDEVKQLRRESGR
jgi:hypothetical protein